jgi:hypothetical protein
MITLEACMMVLLATAAVVLAFTKCKCPAATEAHRIAFLPTALDELHDEEERRSLTLHS